MEIILLERVPNLGQMGDIVKVKPGFARNFLLPRHKALRASEANKKVFAARRKEIEARNLERRQEAEAVAATMTGKRIVLVRQAGESGQLYGSASARDIADALGVIGFSVERGQIELSRPIKELGIHPVIVRLHPDVTVDVALNVARSEAEAELQWQTGGAIVGEQDDVAEDKVEDAAEIDTEQLVADLLEESHRADARED